MFSCISFDFSKPPFPQLYAATEKNLQAICAELRDRLIVHSQTHGGHFASGLGVIELTVALHASFEFRKHRLIWDTGHQAYPHKLLTQRAHRLMSIRQWDGLHPFPYFQESEYDFGICGHAGNSLSLALGASWTANESREKIWTVAVIGDGALESGLTLEALNHLLDAKDPLLIIINHNGYSISKSVGYCTQWLQHHLRSRPVESFKPQNDEKSRIEVIWEPSGHDVWKLKTIMTKLQRKERQVQIMIVATEKGRGFDLALQDPETYHTYPLKPSQKQTILQEEHQSFAKFFSDWLCEKGKKDSKLRVICPAMTRGSHLKKFADLFPQRFIDVGIAESHAVAMAAGASFAGLRAVVVIYSTFLQRAYDQIMHDLAIARLPVILAIDRAGLAGGDGQTHQGIYDIAFLQTIPHLKIFVPSSCESFLAILEAVYKEDKGPLAIRMPKKSIGFYPPAPPGYQTYELQCEKDWPIKDGLCKRLRWKFYTPSSLLSQSPGVLLNFGTQLSLALQLASHYRIALLDCPLASPLSPLLLHFLAERFSHWISLEEGVCQGGVSGSLAQWLVSQQAIQLYPNHRLCTLGLPHAFIAHGSVKAQMDACHLTLPDLIERLKAFFNQSPMMQ